MNTEEFDRLIKAASEKELDVPPFFDWDNMNIPVKKKKKKRIYVLWLLLLLIGSVLGYWKISSEKNSAPQEHSSNIAPHTQQAGSTKEDVNSEDTTTFSNASSKVSAPSAIVGAASDSSIVNISKQEEEKITIHAVKPPTRARNKRLEKRDKTPTLPASPALPVITENAKDNDPFDTANVHQNVAFHTQKIDSRFSLLRVAPASLLYANKGISVPEKPKQREWMVSAGVNSYRNIQSSAQNSSRRFGASSLGQTVAFALLHPIEKNTFILLGLKYNRLNHYHEDMRDLGFSDDLNTGQRISSQYVLKHNNRHHIVGADIGVQRIFPFSPTTQFYLQGEVSPLLSIASRGKIFASNSNELIELSSSNTDAAFLLSGSLGAGLNISVTPQTTWVLGTSFTHFFNRFQLTSELKEYIQPQVVTISVGWRKRI